MNRRQMISLSLGAFGASALSLSLPRWARAGACAEAGFIPTFRTPEHTLIGPAGAILIGLEQRFGGGDEEPLGGRYTLTVRGEPVRLLTAPLAPGLLRLVPARFPTGAAGGPSEAEGVVSGPAGSLRVRLTATPAAPPAPCHLESARIRRNPGSSEPYSPATWSLSARLREALPSNVLGVIVAPAEARSAYGLYAATSASADQFLYRSPGRCEGGIPGANPPGEGRRIRLACVGKNGAVSVRSNDIEIDG